MSQFTAKTTWTKTDAPFTYEAYDRSHELRFGSGTTIPASSAPDFKGDPTRVNPEEALVGALSSCHLLTFLAVAAKRGHVVERYEDDAEGVLAKNAEGRLAVTKVTLRPRVWFTAPVSAEDLARLHDQAHRGCFIGNSVKSEVVIEPQAT